MGGGFSQKGDTATIKLLGTSVTYTAGNPEVIVDGTSYQNTHRLLRFAQASDEEAGAVSPLLMDSTLFILRDLCPGDCPNFELNVTQDAPEAHILILGGYADELSTEEIKLYNLLEHLP